MSISARSALIAGVATVTASAVLIAPSVEPLPPMKPTIQLAVSSQALQQHQVLQPQFDPAAFLIGIPPSLGKPFPTPNPPPPAPVPGSIGSSIKQIYISVEPWVDYGFELGAWAFGWLPYIGWLNIHIWPIGYNLGERIARSITFNIADWLDNRISFREGLVNVGADTIDALVIFGFTEVYYWTGWLLGWLPPLPGILSTPEQTTLMGSTTKPVDELANSEGELLDGITAPVNNEIGFEPGLLKDTSDRFPPVSDVVEQSIPEAVEEAAEDAGESARGPHIRSRANQAGELAEGPQTPAMSLLRSQGEVRGVVANAAVDAIDAAPGNKPVKVNEEVAKAPTTGAKGLNETARKSVKDAGESAADAREAASERTPGHEE
jgi:hypothetical protein